MWTKALYLGDSRDLIKKVPDHFVDLILTDPPYNIGKYSTGNIPLPGRSAINNDVAEWDRVDFWNFSTQAEMHNFVESPICMRPERLSHPKHPAQKPASILKKMISIASNDGDVVFDPFMGVGSVGVASLSLHRRYIGCEIDETYFMAAKERIEERRY